MPTVEIKGLDQLAKTLEQDLPEKMAKGVIRDALEAGSHVIEQAIKSSAPVKSGELSEDIVSKITVRNNRGGLSAVAIIGPEFSMTGLKTRKRGKYAGQPDRTTSPGIYSLFVELGHAPPGMGQEKKAAKRKGFQIEFGGKDTPPHPFMGPAFEGAKEEALNAIVDALRSGIEEAARAVAKKQPT